MALAPYFHRSAVAASQVLAGFDEEAIRRRLEEVRLELFWGADVVDSAEGRALLDLSIRLIGRLYPRIRLVGPDPGDQHEALLREINPEIETADGAISHRVVLGSTPAEGDALNLFAGSKDWDALVSTRSPQDVGDSANPFGAGAAACFAAANLFRSVFLDDSQLDEDLAFSTLELDSQSTRDPILLSASTPQARTVLVGAGAVGNAVIWALGRVDTSLELHVVDPEPIEASNLQRYVLAGTGDTGLPKVDVVRRTLRASVAHSIPWEEFVATEGYDWDRALVALDSADDRRQVQASLPKWIANAWTQAGDLGVSVHPWNEGACLRCLYLPKGVVPSQDELVAAALGFADDQHRAQVRQLIYNGQPAPPQLLEESAAALGVDPNALLAYRNRPIRDLYVEGICGGAVLPLDRVGRPAEDVQVPLAHQSALAGIVLAARLIGDQLGRGAKSAAATRIDLMHRLGSHLTQPIAKDPRGICICQDAVYQAAWDEKYGARS
jgi:hypothetical protein